MQYESQVKKLLLILERERQNALDSDSLQKITHVPRPENFRKQVGVITLTTGFNIQTGTTKPDGYINPLVKVVQGIPQISPPPPIFPVILNLSLAGNPVPIPNMVANYDTNLLMVVHNSNYLPVPDTKEDMQAITVTVNPSVNGVPQGAQPLLGTPSYVGQGVFNIPLSGSTPGSELNINDLTSITLNVNSADGSLSSTMTIQVDPYIPVDTQPPGSTQVSPNIGPSAGNPLATTQSPMSQQVMTGQPSFNLPNIPAFSGALVTNQQIQVGSFMPNLAY